MGQAGLGLGSGQKGGGQRPRISVRTQRHRQGGIEEPVGHVDLKLGHAGIETLHHHVQIALQNHLNGVGFGQSHLVALHQAAQKVRGFHLAFGDRRANDIVLEPAGKREHRLAPSGRRGRQDAQPEQQGQQSPGQGVNEVWSSTH